MPTETWVTGLTAPLADTVACRLPRSMLAVRYCTFSGPAYWVHHHAETAATTTSPGNTNQRDFVISGF